MKKKKLPPLSVVIEKILSTSLSFIPMKITLATKQRISKHRRTDQVLLFTVQLLIDSHQKKKKRSATKRDLFERRRKQLCSSFSLSFLCFSLIIVERVASVFLCSFLFSFFLSDCSRLFSPFPFQLFLITIPSKTFKARIFQEKKKYGRSLWKKH